jgi:adenylate kinase
MGLCRFAVTLLIGAPGAGKGTQARFLCDTLSIPHVASGDLLRDHRRRGTDLGTMAKQYMDRGDLVPDRLVVDMVLERLQEPDASCGVLLDGFPRTAAQAQTLDHELEARGGGVTTALFLDVPTDVLVDRLAGRRVCTECQATYNIYFQNLGERMTCFDCDEPLVQRPDDRRDVVERRVEVYTRETTAVLDHYRTRGLLRQIDGHRPIQDVRQDLVRTVLPGAAQSRTAETVVASPPNDDLADAADVEVDPLWSASLAFPRALERLKRTATA